MFYIQVGFTFLTFKGFSWGPLFITPCSVWLISLLRESFTLMGRWWCIGGAPIRISSNQRELWSLAKMCNYDKISEILYFFVVAIFHCNTMNIQKVFARSDLTMAHQELLCWLLQGPSSALNQGCLEEWGRAVCFHENLSIFQAWMIKLFRLNFWTRGIFAGTARRAGPDSMSNLCPCMCVCV